MKKRRIILGCVLSTGATALGFWIVSAAVLGNRSGVAIGMPRKSAAVAIAFGKVCYGQTTRHQLVVRNISDRTLSLGEQTGCGCTRVKIFNPVLPPGGRSVVRVSYTGLFADQRGPVRQQFLIFDASRGAAIPEVQGSVEAVVVGSLRFSRTEVYWHYVPGKPVHRAQSVIAENITDDPISVAWNAHGEGRFFTVVPSSDVIAPGTSERFLFRPSVAMVADRRPAAEVITLQGTLRSKGKRIPLNFKFDVYATPVPVLEAVPGALVLSPGTRTGSISKIVRLVTGPGIGSPPHVFAVTSSGPGLHAALEDGRIVVLLRLFPGHALFQGDVHVAYFYDGVKSTLDIPVFAAPDIVGH